MYSASREIEELAKRVFRLEKRAQSDTRASTNELRDRLGRLERRTMGTPYTDRAEAKPQDQARYLNEKAKKDANLIQSLYKRIDDANEAGAEMAKLRNENRMLVDGVNHRAAEITRQQDRSLVLLGSLRESHTKIKNQKKSLSDLHMAHDKALDRIRELEDIRRILDDRNRELTSDANLAFTYEAQLAQLREDLEGERAKYYRSIKANQELGAENARLNVKVASALAELEDNEDN